MAEQTKERKRPKQSQKQDLKGSIHRAKKKNKIELSEWQNTKTGEKRDFATVQLDVYKDTNFYKVFLGHLLPLLESEFGKGKMSVLFYILDNIESSSNMFIGTVREIAKETKTALPTVSGTIQALLRIDFFRKKQNGVYMISPKYIIKGGADKRYGLMVKYNELPYPKEDAEKYERQMQIFEDEKEEVQV